MHPFPLGELSSLKKLFSRIDPRKLVVVLRFPRTQNTDDQVSIGIALQLLDPGFHVVERGTFGDVKDQNGGVSFAVIHGSHGSETFLTRRVPNLSEHIVMHFMYSALKRSIHIRKDEMKKQVQQSSNIRCALTCSGARHLIIH